MNAFKLVSLRLAGESDRKKGTGCFRKSSQSPFWVPRDPPHPSSAPRGWEGDADIGDDAVDDRLAATCGLFFSVKKIIASALPPASAKLPPGQGHNEGKNNEEEELLKHFSNFNAIRKNRILEEKPPDPLYGLADTPLRATSLPPRSRKGTSLPRLRCLVAPDFSESFL
jgi:hypothetical protein